MGGWGVVLSGERDYQLKTGRNRNQRTGADWPELGGGRETEDSCGV